MSQNELYHYGVLGMKWGVRRGNTSKAYEKASKKLRKLDQKVNKQETKLIRKTARADRVLGSRFTNGRRREHARRKAEISAGNYRKRVRKAERWYKSMEKTFKNTDVSMTAEQTKMGKRYVDILRADSLGRY